ncbi:MAG: HDOD domain-containing protein [Limisphaerales bacterium]
MKSLEEQLAEVPFFPPAIHVVPRLLPLLGNNQYPTDALADVVRVDTGLTADILRVCNSASFGFSLRAHTIQEAILRVGLRELYTITTKVIAAPILESGKHNNLVHGADLWHHSLATAAASAVLAHVKGTDPEIAFTAGLLHDIGKVRLVHTVGSQYGDLILEARNGSEPLHVLEARKWGIDHAVIAGNLLKSWSFPQAMRDAVLLHHSVAGSTPNLDAAALLNLANYLAGAIGFQYDRLAPLHAPHPRALQLLGMTMDQLNLLQGQALDFYNREKAPFVSDVT